MTTQIKTIMEEVRIVESYTCDACGVTVDPGGEGMMEAQEWLHWRIWLHWRMRGGYASIFGDEADISLDLCQKCIKERLGDVLKVGPSWLEQAEPLD